MNNKNLIYIAVGVGVVGYLYMKNKKPKQVIKKGDLKEDDFGESSTISSGGGGGNVGGGGYMGLGMGLASTGTNTPNITINNSTPATPVSPSSSVAPEVSLPPRTSTSPTAVRPNVTAVMPLPSATLPVRTNFLGFDGDMSNKTRRFDFSTDF